MDFEVFINTKIYNTIPDFWYYFRGFKNDISKPSIK